MINASYKTKLVAMKMLHDMFKPFRFANLPTGLAKAKRIGSDHKLATRRLRLASQVGSLAKMFGKKEGTRFVNLDVLVVITFVFT